jgi:hypothetical protein
VYRKLYEEGVCIIWDFFDDPTNECNMDTNYPPPLFACSDAQANYITRAGISRETIFDGVKRSNVTCGYDTHLVTSKPNKKKSQAPGLDSN